MLVLTDEERFALGDEAPQGLAMAMRIVAETARVLGAPSLIPITSAHVDGCLYHGDSSTHFAERLNQLGARVMVPTTLNVGSIDLAHPELVLADAHYLDMSQRVMTAYEQMGCEASWTCAPYQVGHRPGVGEHVAWGESNAVAFANSVLGARTNRNGDFLDVCCAITSRAPFYGLHRDDARRATVHVALDGLSAALRTMDAFHAVLGAWLGHEYGNVVSVIDGLDPDVSEDQLKALGAGAASTGAVGLFHVAGVTPEAPDVNTALGGIPALETRRPGPADIRAARDRLSTATTADIDSVALGSPHFSFAECEQLAACLAGRTARVPVYVCTNRHVMAQLESSGLDVALGASGVSFVVDTCIAVAPILHGESGVMMTNSAKFAHYAPANTGHASVFGTLQDCVASALTSRVTRDESVWQ